MLSGSNRVQIRQIALIFFIIVFCCQVSGLFWSADTREEPGSPVVIIPGTGASQLEARVNRHHGVAPHCEKRTDWRRAWLNVWQLLAGPMDCWCDDIKLIYDPKTGKSHNTPGVETRIPGWGRTETLEYLDPSWTAKTLGVASYAAKLVERLAIWGYERGKSVVGAPYDWRYAPHSQDDYFQRLKKLIEKTYNVNNRKKVTIFAHSLGSLFGLYFLNEQSLEWKYKYIQAFVTAGAPWEGSAIEYQLFASGMNFDVPTMDPFVIRHEQRTQENNMLMLPRIGAEWEPQDIFIVAPRRNYSANNIHDFMIDVGFPLGNDMTKHYSSPKYALKHPEIPFHCITSNGISTAERFIYDKGFDEQKFPRIVNGDGDGSVNVRSLRSCKRMAIPGKFRHHEISGVAHNNILGNEELFSILKTILYS